MSFPGLDYLHLRWLDLIYMHPQWTQGTQPPPWQGSDIPAAEPPPPWQQNKSGGRLGSLPRRPCVCGPFCLCHPKMTQSDELPAVGDYVALAGQGQAQSPLLDLFLLANFSVPFTLTLKPCCVSPSVACFRPLAAGLHLWFLKFLPSLECGSTLLPTPSVSYTKNA